MATYKLDEKVIKDYQLKVLNAANQLRNFEERYLNTLATMVMSRVLKTTPVRTGR